MLIVELVRSIFLRTTEYPSVSENLSTHILGTLKSAKWYEKFKRLRHLHMSKSSYCLKGHWLIFYAHCYQLKRLST